MKKWGWIIGFIVLVIAVWECRTVYHHAVTKHEKELQKSGILVKQTYHLKKILNVTEYRGKDAYHIVKGVNQKDKTVYVWLPEGNGKPFMKLADDGWNKHQVRQYVQQKLHPKQLITIQLGAEDGIPLWEITYRDQKGRYTFYDLRFKDGLWYKNIHL